MAGRTNDKDCLAESSDEGCRIRQLGEKHYAESTPQWVWEVFASEEGILNQERLQ
jgi:hypothetical protein